ncbi:hypothetical protein MRX96_055289 [Rhipicephalus microplus]
MQGRSRAPSLQSPPRDGAAYLRFFGYRSRRPYHSPSSLPCVHARRAAGYVRGYAKSTRPLFLPTCFSCCLASDSRSPPTPVGRQAGRSVRGPWLLPTFLLALGRALFLCRERERGEKGKTGRRGGKGSLGSVYGGRPGPGPGCFPNGPRDASHCWRETRIAAAPRSTGIGLSCGGIKSVQPSGYLRLTTLLMIAVF